MEDGYKLKQTYQWEDLMEYIQMVSPGLHQMIEEAGIKPTCTIQDKKLSNVLTASVVWPTEFLERITRLHDYLLSRETHPYKVVNAGQNEWRLIWGQFQTMEEAIKHRDNFSYPEKVEIKILY